MLTVRAIEAAKPREKVFRLADSAGLMLEVPPRGSKRWRLRYRHRGKEKMLSLGIYPDITLAVARKLRDEARSLIAQGIDPSAARKAERANANAVVDTFESVAREWHATNRAGWVAEHASTILRRLERDVFPFIGSTPIGEVRPSIVLELLRRIERRGANETAKRTKVVIGQVCRYAVATDRAEFDPTASLKGALAPVKSKHFAALTTPKAVAAALRAFESYQGTPIVRAALAFAPMVFVRPGELRQARWADIDLDASRWTFTATKTDTPHIVPLSTQATSVLSDLQPVTCDSVYVFPSDRSKARPMSNNALTAAYKRMGLGDELTAHGWRATARTLLAEELGYRAEVIEMQLAHKVCDHLGRAYNRTQWLKDRTQMMQEWADALDRWRADEDLA